MLSVLGHLIWVGLPPCWLFPINLSESTASSLSMTMCDNSFRPNRKTSLGNCDPRDQTYFPISAISFLPNSFVTMLQNDLHTFTRCDFCPFTWGFLRTFTQSGFRLPLHSRTSACLHSARLSTLPLPRGLLWEPSQLLRATCPTLFLPRDLEDFKSELLNQER